MNAADTYFFKMVSEARKDRAAKALMEKIADCPMSEKVGCDGSCENCEHALKPSYVERDFEHIEYTSVCPSCQKGYLSEHGQNWTCRACRREHPLGEMKFGNRGGRYEQATDLGRIGGTVPSRRH